MEYHRTKDILYVKLLGHKNIANTLIYTQLVEFEGDEYCSAVARNVEEAQKLVEAGFEYVCNHNETILSRARALFSKNQPDQRMIFAKAPVWLGTRA